MEYACRFVAEGDGTVDFMMEVIVPVTTLCPCSKEISSRGAHNQRGYVAARVRFKDHLWLEEIVQAVEEAASCSLYPVLKRPDEKWVTEHAYDNPRFVEDVVREVALRFDAEPRITWYEIEVENHESIHAHNAYASLKREKR
jgi:GTP cyclohydrolase I